MDGLTLSQRRALLIEEASRWVGIQESGGNNRGQLVEIFLRASKIGPGNPWCAAFVQYCIAQIDKVALVLNSTAQASKMPAGALCMALWNGSPLDIRYLQPEPGDIVIWKHPGTMSGHTGLVTAFNAQTREFRTIEGNTSPAPGVNRDGDGVFQKTHKIGSTGGSLELVGFISPWGRQ